MDLPINAHGVPMTYLANGKQYIVVAIGGVTREAELVAQTVHFEGGPFALKASRGLTLTIR